MANQLANNPWAIDTPGTNVIYPYWIKSIQFEFIYAASGDAVTVQDSLGNLVWQATGTSNSEVQRSGKVGPILGLKVPSLTAGDKLLMFVE